MAKEQREATDLNNKEKQVKISTLIGKGSELIGDFSVKGSARIDGKITGNVNVSGTLLVGATGSINGNVSANAIVVGGEVLGDITAPEKTELTATARVLGDVATKVIVIDENAVFQGRCDMNQTEPERKAKLKVASKTARAGKKSAKAAIAEALKEVEEEANREASMQDKENVATEEVVAENSTKA